MHLARTRVVFFLAFIACELIMGVAFYLERVVGLMPNPLGILQRSLFLFCGLVCLVATLHAPSRRGWRIYCAVIAVTALLGAAFAARQVALQASPPEDLVLCLVNQQSLLETLPFMSVVWQILLGQADCSEITWSLFGISLPEWSLLAFSGLSVFALYYAFIEFRRSGSMDTALSD
jgi:disulfide bond formation protein DsbB